MNNANVKNVLMMAILFGLFFWSLEYARKQNPAPESSSSATVQSSSAQVTPQASSSSVAVVDSNKVDSAAKDSVVTAVQRHVVIETETMIVTLDTKGAKIRDVVYKGLPNDQGQRPSLFLNPDSGALAFTIAGQDFSSQIFTLADSIQDTLRVAGEDKKTIRMLWTDAQGKSVERRFSFNARGGEIKADLGVTGFDPAAPMTLKWNSGLRETDAHKVHREGFIGTDYFFSEAVLHDGAEVLHEMPTSSLVMNEEHGQVTWMGVRRKYIAAAVEFNTPSEGKVFVDPIASVDSNKNIKGSYALRVEDQLSNGRFDLKFVVLPLEYHNLKEMGRDYDAILWSGYGWFFGADYWFPLICGWILWLLNYFFGLVANYGIAIILLTLVVRGLTTPLTLTQMRSTRLLQEHKPALDSIREKFGKEPAKYQQELMAYYKQAGINPFAPLLGCFPVLLQMPVFIALFVVLARSPELRDAAFFAWINDLSSPDILFPAIKIPFVMPAGLSLLPFLMAITTWYQTKQTITDPNMKMMVWMMPLMMFLFSGLMPSGLVVYWIVSNIYSIVQYMLVGTPKAVVDASGKPMVQGQKAFQQGKSKKGK